MSTVGEVVDRVYRDWLAGPDEQPVTATLDGAIDNSTVTVVIDQTGLLPEEQELVAVGQLIEIGSELQRIRAVSSSTLTVARGVNGTTKAAHADGAEVILSPSYPRQTVVDAVCDEVVRLFPSLMARKTTALTTASTYVEVPDAVVVPIKFWWQSGSQWTDHGTIKLLTDFPDSSTNKAVQFVGIPTGKAGHLVYDGKFTRPTAESDDLTASFSVESGWDPILTVGAAAAIIASEDLDKASVEWVSRQLEAQQFPVGSSSRLRDALLRYREYLLNHARRSQRANGPTTVLHTREVGI